ncbi:MAG TPA: PAS domain-containing sensor histidine kinase [Spirochaetia bacterium]|nr:PAS domain-containing sensor histidine kinase [Spirochaetia bacterium]
MKDNPDLPAITRLLRSITTGKYQQLTADEDASPEVRDFVRSMNGLAEQRDDLVRSYNEDLRQSEARLRGIIESTPVGICITDENGYYEYVNPTYCRLYGYTPDELIGNHFTIVVPEEYQEQLIHLHSEFMGKRYELRGEWQVKRKDGSPLAIIADAAYIVDVDGRPKKVTFVLDISERKRAEELLHETVGQLNDEIHQREELEKVKVQVERMIRHDLRNPLNGIIAAAEILMVDELNDEQRELCMIIRESGRKLDSMLSSSMDLIKMEEGTYVLRPQPVNLIAVLQEVRREVEPLAGNTGVEVDFWIDGDLVQWNAQLPMEGERLYLADALANLIRNAIEASSDGDTVDIRVSVGDEYRIEIHNSGVVPEDIRHVFFDRYATSGKKNGTGLGTYVAALITRVHNGRIDFTTSEEDGTRVVLHLPRKQPSSS